jgi:GTP cyclohydrolase III
MPGLRQADTACHMGSYGVIWGQALLYCVFIKNPVHFKVKNAIMQGLTPYDQIKNAIMQGLTPYDHCVFIKNPVHFKVKNAIMQGLTPYDQIKNAIMQGLTPYDQGLTPYDVLKIVNTNNIDHFYSLWW